MGGGECSKLSKEVKPINVDDQDNLNDCDHGCMNLDDSVSDDSHEVFDDASDLKREWQRRHDEFHRIGYGDGLFAGMEASAQEGFNTGFKQSVVHGYRWGLVRGITSAFSNLPDLLKRKLVEAPEKREEFRGLYESVRSLSTKDALRMFNDNIKANEALEKGDRVEVSPNISDSHEQTLHGSLGLESYTGKLKSLIERSPGIDNQIPEPKYVMVSTLGCKTV